MAGGHQVKAKVIAVSDSAAMARAAADRIMTRIAANNGRVAICLAGGSSPKQLYSLLATESWRARIPWDRVHWFIGDERFVPADDPRNNMAMARQTMLDACAPVANIHPMATDGADPDAAARHYELELKEFYGASELDAERPLFDVVLMGIGPDGHTASLFPGDPAIEATGRWVVGVERAPVEPLVPRVTLTLPTLGCCREMLFEVAGPAKRPILTRLLHGENLPANRARAVGETIWLVDRAALPEDFSGQ
jgi:6-phosphogluconolactonase